MSQRDSGYERRERDLYETPGWVTDVVVNHIPMSLLDSTIWEPAAGSGKMAGALRLRGFKVDATDIAGDVPADFLTIGRATAAAIITNPPYEKAREFIEHALDLMRPNKGLVAMLLRTDFDHAKTRQHLFSECEQFKKKVVLTKRIKWFEESKGSPSFNHAWFIWDWKHEGPPTLAYGP